MSFRQFVTLHKTENSPAGDVARDLLDDPCAKGLRSWNSLRKHMIQHNACEEALEALDNLYRAFIDRAKQPRASPASRG